ncbi:MAG TPA: hypothetical protein VF664_09265 [Cystobacter sp.]
MRERVWRLLLGAWLCGCGEGDGRGEGALPVDSAGPWSQEAVLDYSKRFAVGTPQSVGLDEGGNLWLLDGARVGVLRPGDSQPTWTSGVGQAGKGFRSSVVCGGSAGRAYVGYLAEELAQPRRDDLDDPVFLEWKVGIVTPPAALGDWDDLAKVPWKLDTYVEALGSQEDMDLWRGFAQTKDGAYWLGSAKYGVWQLTPSPRAYERLEGLPTQRIRALAATPDGALLVGTEDRGLWRRAPDGTLARVEGVAGERVLQLVVDDGLRPAMVLALTDKGLTVLRVR